MTQSNRHKQSNTATELCFTETSLYLHKTVKARTNSCLNCKSVKLAASLIH